MHRALGTPHGHSIWKGSNTPFGMNVREEQAVVIGRTGRGPGLVVREHEMPTISRLIEDRKR